MTELLVWQSISHNPVNKVFLAPMWPPEEFKYFLTADALAKLFTFK
jgi:hypothetical protein